MTWSHVELDIDCAAIGHNVALIRRSIGPERRLCAIVKADAYGLGAEVLGPRIERAGADMLAVFSLDEVSVLLEAEVRIPILVLMPVWDVPRHHAIHLALAEQRLHLTVHDAGHLDRLESMVGGDGVGPPVRLPVHLEVDTGMSRGGCGLESAEPLIRRVAASPSVRLAGIMTHFAKAETDADCTDGQLGRFEALLDRVRSILPDDCLVHAANTHAMLRSDRYQLGMVRIGLAWAGYGPETLVAGPGDLEERWPLRPSIRWSARIVHVRTIEPGTTVGYGRRWTATRRTHLGLVPVGYADGYPINLSSTDAEPQPARIGVEWSPPDTPPGAAPLVEYAPVVGAISMDQLTVDLTDLVERSTPDRRPGVGTTVRLVDDRPGAVNHLPTIARAAGLRTHEFLCRIRPRGGRCYQDAAIGGETGGHRGLDDAPVVRTTGRGTPGVARRTI